jgi:hypothetical protein
LSTDYASPESNYRPRTPAQAEEALAAGIPFEKLDLGDWERDVLILHDLLPGNRDEAILSLSRLPVLLPDGARVGRDSRKIRQRGGTLWSEEEDELERLSLLTLAVAEMKTPTEYLPGLYQMPQVVNGGLLIPMAPPLYMTRVENGRVVRRSISKSSSPYWRAHPPTWGAGRLRCVPEGVETRPWDWPWVYVLRRYLPWKLDLFDGRSEPREIPGLGEDSYTGQLVKDRPSTQPNAPRPLSRYEDLVSEYAVDGVFASHVIGQLSNEERQWLQLRLDGYSPENAAYLFNLGPEAGWQRDKRLRDKIERLEGGQTIRKVFTKGEQMSMVANEIKAHVDRRFDQLERRSEEREARRERLEAMRAESMDSVRATVEKLAQRFPDDQRVQDAVAEFLEEGSA